MVSLSSPPARSFLPLCSFTYMPSFSLSSENKQKNKQKGKRKSVRNTYTHTDTCPHRKPRTPQNHFCGHSEDLAVSHRHSGDCSSYLPSQKSEAPPKPKASPVLYSGFYLLPPLQGTFLIPFSPLPIHLHRCSSHINVFS